MRTLTMLIFLFVTLLSGTCSKGKKAVSTAQQNFSSTDVIKFNKYKCRGNCPVYELTISGDGQATLKGVENLSLIGNFKKEIGKEKAAQLLGKMQEMMPVLKDEYLPVISDYQIIEVSASIDGRKKNVKCQHEAPEDYKALIDELEAIVAADGWKAQ